MPYCLENNGEAIRYGPDRAVSASNPCDTYCLRIELEAIRGE